MQVGLLTLSHLPLPGEADGALVPPSDVPGSRAHGGDAAKSEGSRAAASNEGDSVELSPAAVEANERLGDGSDLGDGADPGGHDSTQEGRASGGSGVRGGDRAEDEAEPGEQPSDAQQPKAPGGQELTKEEQEQVKELKERDAEVRRHEAAHKGAAGVYAKGGPTYEYQQGPDGKRYAIGGSVQIDTSPVPGDPQATIQKMQVVRRAALAPGDPSSQDRAVAAQAARAAQKAQQELREQRTEEQAPGADQGDAQASGGSAPAGPQSDAHADDVRAIGPSQKNPPETVGALTDSFA